MLISINEISIPVPHTKKIAKIILNGKNLIITGGNGSGKTSFILSIYEFLKKSLNDPTNNDINYLELTLKNYKDQMNAQGRDSNNFAFFNSEVNKIEARIKQLKDFSINVNHKDSSTLRSLLRFHIALREASISAPQFVPRLATLKEENSHFENDINGDNIFENYLVSLKTSQSYAISFESNIQKSESIQKWFDKIQFDLRELFEDKELRLEFDSDEAKFYIHQNEKEKYTFQNLSSGFSSILRIYADLIMRVVMWDRTPENIEGIVFIDEIDAHLHVSLQKKILRFFSKAFPKIQFIVTTHSPFVVSSVTDAIIYDLSSNEQVAEVSSYSYNIILEELFGVSPISNALTDKLSEIEGSIKNLNKDNYEKTNELVNSLAPSENHMDDESSAFLDFAKLKLIKFKNNGNQGE